MPNTSSFSVYVPSTRGVMIPGPESIPESDFQLFSENFDSDSNSNSTSCWNRFHSGIDSESGIGSSALIGSSPIIKWAPICSKRSSLTLVFHQILIKIQPQASLIHSFISNLEEIPHTYNLFHCLKYRNQFHTWN